MKTQLERSLEVENKELKKLVFALRSNLNNHILHMDRICRVVNGLAALADLRTNTEHNVEWYWVMYALEGLYDTVSEELEEWKEEKKRFAEFAAAVGKAEVEDGE